VCLTQLWSELHRSEVSLCVCGVIGENICAVHHFTARFVDELSHLCRGVFRELVDICTHKLRCLGNDESAISIGGMLPYLERFLRRD